MGTPWFGRTNSWVSRLRFKPLREENIDRESMRREAFYFSSRHGAEMQDSSVSAQILPILKQTGLRVGYCEAV